MLAVEALYKMAGELFAVSGSDRAENAFKAVVEGTSLEGIQSLMALIEDSKIEVEACNFRRDDNATKYLSELNGFRTRILEALLVRDRSTTGPFFSEGSLERIGGIAEAVTEALDKPSSKLDRIEFSEATRKLIEVIRTWELGEYEQRALLLTLNMLVAQLNASELSFSDNEIRRRIKMIVADFAFEFMVLDKEFETLKRWARLGYQGSSVPLGLANNALKIAGLLTKQ